MNRLDQLGIRINLICNVFDKWIGQQDRSDWKTF